MEQTIQHSAAWALAIIMIVVISWFFYRYLAPKSWHEWASAGVVHWPTLFSVGLFPVIVFAYYMLARKEERQVLAEFGETYRAYQQRVPMFIPRREQWRAFVGSSSLNSDD